MSIGVAPAGPFRGFVPFDDGDGETFFGRSAETARLAQLVFSEGSRLIALSGEPGVGKTSLLHAGLIRAVTERGGLGIYLGSYRELDAEVLRATSRLGLDPPAPHQDSSDYLARIARESRGGTVLVLDHLEEVLASPPALAAVGVMIARVVEAGGGRVRIVLSLDQGSFARLGQLHAAAGVSPTPNAWMLLERLTEEQAREILERTSMQTGLFFEAGLASVMAGDLCRSGSCRPLDLQLLARVVLDLRLTTIRKYERSGGVATLPAMFFERLCAAAGGRAARRLLLAIADVADEGGAATGVERGTDGAEPGGERAAESSVDALQARAGIPRPELTNALGVMKARGVVQSRPAAAGELWSLVHPALRSHIDAFAIGDRARAVAARRDLRRRVTAGQRIKLFELYAIRRYLGGALANDEQGAVTRSLRRNLLQVGLGVALILGMSIFLFMNLRRSYTLGFEPAGGGKAARVVVRLGRGNLSALNFLPSRPRLGSVLADTGFSAASLVSETADRIAAGKASGQLDAGGAGGAAAEHEPAAHAAAVPGWLREVLNGLRPVPRGVAKALLGDPDGVTSLKHAFSDPLARRETLEALAVIGRGRAGEDEILAAALADPAPEIRRRGVEVAAAIDRRAAEAAAATAPPGNAGARPGARGAGASPAPGGTGAGSHAATLRSALADKSIDVRKAVLAETATLPAAEAASILTVALRDPEPGFRHSAELAAEALAQRAPAATADAVQQVLQSPDGGVRRSGLALLERIAARAPSECAGALARVVANEQAPEEARVAALLVLRKAGPPAPTLAPALEKAVRPEASPRLRAAALPLYARLIPPEQAEEIARAEMKGTPAARAAGAAVWGTIAQTRPDLAATPLKSMLYDTAPEARLEAARSFAFLKRDGIGLCDKALNDPNAEVERAAIESALALAPTNPYQVAEMLGHAVKTVRPAVRRQVVEALGRLGETRPAAALPPLARTLKETDGGARAAAAAAFCVISKKNAAAASPYLRIAARDDRHDVRTAAAACLGNLGGDDPKGAAKIAIELADAEEASVRTAAAEALGRLASRARDLALPTLLKLIGDPDRAVRIAAERAFGAAGAGGGRGGAFADSKRGGEAERTLNAALVQADTDERRVVVAAAADAGLVGVLRQATADGDETVRLDAVKAAGALSPPALDVVRGAVDDRANAVRAEATRILSGLSGAGAREVLPIFESMLHGGDKSAREAAVLGVGDLPGAGQAGARLLGEALAQRSESLRTAAALALGRLAEREPDYALGYLEQAVRDSSYDVRNAAIPGLALAWSRKQSADELGAALIGSETDSPRRFVALEALVMKAQRGTAAEKSAARKALDHAATEGPPLARLAAQIGRAFVHESSLAMHTFIEHLLGS